MRLTTQELAEYDDWMDYLASKAEAEYQDRYGDPEPESETKKAEGADDSNGPIPF